MIVLVPNLCGKLIQNLAWHVPAIRFQLVDPNYQLMPLGLRECQDTIFQLSYAHRKNNGTKHPLLQAFTKLRKPIFSSRKGGHAKAPATGGFANRPARTT